MNFNINEVLDNMLAAIKGSVGGDWSKVKSIANQFLERNEKRLKMIAKLRVDGELNQKEFESRILDQKLILEAELNAIAVISKAKAQNAANAAMEVLNKAITVAIDTAL
jgi:hypothetical protein|tara:strand:+ start:20231 stop:20557 length:327 start_codon:yes stop_codon:yes gene_type:complete